MQLRKACGGQKLRDIMLDANVELYGPYVRTCINMCSSLIPFFFLSLLALITNLISSSKCIMVPVF